MFSGFEVNNLPIAFSTSFLPAVFATDFLTSKAVEVACLAAWDYSPFKKLTTESNIPDPPYTYFLLYLRLVTINIFCT